MFISMLLLPLVVRGQALENTLIEKYPYLAHIIAHRKPCCAGSVISTNTVLTAAQCLTERTPADLSVVVGGSSFVVKWTASHPEYNASLGHDRDVGIIRVCDVFEFGPAVQPVVLSADRDIPVGVEGTLAGWGDQYRSHHLRVVHIPIIDSDACQHAHFPAVMITANMLCTWRAEAHRTACDGDAGGPLVVRDQQVGVVSFGAECGSGNPSIYTKVAAVLAWIHEAMSSE